MLDCFATAVFKGHRGALTISGGYCVGETPLPIPNRAVKPHSADGTWLARAWESRSPPVPLTEPPAGRLFFVVPQALGPPGSAAARGHWSLPRPGRRDQSSQRADRRPARWSGPAVGRATNPRGGDPAARGGRPWGAPAAVMTQRPAGRVPGQGGGRRRETRRRGG